MFMNGVCMTNNIYICIYTFVYAFVCVYIYIYTHILVRVDSLSLGIHIYIEICIHMSHDMYVVLWLGRWADSVDRQRTWHKKGESSIYILLRQ